MNKHSIVKTALGTGLMAASLAASAAIHTFAEPMIFYKIDGAKVYYTAFLPSLALGASAGVVMLELYNSGTVSSWHYALGGSISDSDNGGRLWSISGGSIEVSAIAFPISSLAADTANTLSTQTWYGGDTGEVSLPFTQNRTISSVACGLTFNAVANIDDYLEFPSDSMTVKPDFWSNVATASADVSYSGGTLDKGSWNAPNFSATSGFAGTISVVGAIAGTQTATLMTYAASSITKANICTSMYTAKNALNSSGATIGGKAGMMRLW